MHFINMNYSSKVSVIIPVYNTEEYIEETLKSICNQTLKEIEIIVINDGSTDNSLKIIEQMQKADCRILIHSQDNQGLSCARNAGIKHVNAPYIYFMDSDDFLEPDALNMCYQKCIENNLDFAFFDADILNKKHKSNLTLLYQRKKYFEKSTIYSGFDALNIQLDTYSYMPSVWLNFISSTFLRKIQLDFYPHIIHEDQLFTCQLYLRATRVMCIPRDFFKRRIREGSIMNNTFSMRNMNCYFIVTDELLKIATTEPKNKDIIKKYLSSMLNAAVWLSWEMPFKDRFFIAKQCICKYKSVVKTYNILIVLFKALLKAKR